MSHIKCSCVCMHSYSKTSNQWLLCDREATQQIAYWFKPLIWFPISYSEYAVVVFFWYPFVYSMNKCEWMCNKFNIFAFCAEMKFNQHSLNWIVICSVIIIGHLHEFIVFNSHNDHLCNCHSHRRTLQLHIHIHVHKDIYTQKNEH